MSVKNAGGECIRLRYQTRRNEIAYSQISNCGRYDFAFRGGGKNGEGIYIGTAPEQRGAHGSSDRSVDASNANHVHHNVIDTKGNECVDIKEGQAVTSSSTINVPARRTRTRVASIPRQQQRLPLQHG